MPPSYASGLPPPYAPMPPFAVPAGPDRYGPSPAARVVLLVALVVGLVLNGGMGTIGTVAVIGGDTSTTSIVLWLAFVVLALLCAAALVGVVLRKEWGRWVAIAAGIVLSLTFIGGILGLPIIFGAVRAPLARAPKAS